MSGALLQSLPGFVSALTLCLCSDIANEHFESGTELVLSVLVERAFTLPELVREVRARAAAPLHLTAYIPRVRSDISGGLVQEALLILVQHGLVHMENISGTFVYQADIAAVLERLRLPQMTALAKNAISAEAAQAFQTVARHGRVRRSEISGSFETVDELLRLGFLRHAGGASEISRKKAEPAAAKAKSRAGAAKTRRRAKHAEAEAPLLEEEVLVVASGTRRGGGVQTTSGGALLSVDVETLRVKLLMEAAVEIMSSRFGAESGRILRVVCERTVSGGGGGGGGLRSDWFGVDSLMNWLQTAGRAKEDQVTRVLTMWTKTATDFVRPWLMTRRADSQESHYRVDFTAICAGVVEDVVCQTLLYRHGQSGLRLYNCLREHGATDVAALSENCLIDREETQTLIAKLVADGFVLAGSAGAGTSHTVWVYGVEAPKVVASTLAILERTTLNLRRRLRAEVFLQTSMEDRAVTFTDEERLYLERVIAAQDVLEAKLVEVGSCIALFRHALSQL